MLPNAYLLEIIQVGMNLIGVGATAFTLGSAKMNLRAVWYERPVDGQRILLAQKNVRREYVSLVHIQGVLLAIGILGLFMPPPPWPWGPIPQSQLTSEQYRIVLSAQIVRVGLTWLSFRKTVNSIQNWIDERPLRKPRRRTDGVITPATIAQATATIAQAQATAAQDIASAQQDHASAVLRGEAVEHGNT